MFGPRPTPIALLNMLSQPTRACVSIAGVAFALLLIFMQLGFRGAVANTATMVYGQMEFDLLVRSPEYLHLYEARSFSRTWTDLIASHPMVESSEPFWIMLQKWQSPSDGSYRAISMIAFPSHTRPLRVPELNEQLESLRDPNAVLIDRATRPDYGPKNGRRFGDADIALPAELGGSTVTIRGHFHMGTGLATNGAVVISDVGYSLRSTLDTRRQCNLGLIRLRPGIQHQDAVDQIRQWLSQRDPNALDAIELLSREQTIRKEHQRWLGETPIGIIFTLGVALAFLVGAAIVYMVLAQDVANRLREYATLKAMGYTTGFVARVVLRQAWLLSVMGFVPALVLAEVLYRTTANLAGIPIGMTWPRVVGVAALSVLMCTLSGLGAVRKLWKAEPASLF
jgi:putative ABC transport system permease protein